MSLVLDGVEKRYPDGAVALAGVSFEVPRGQVCVILGPSGAGKSTLLRCVNGLVTPSSGQVRLNGVVVGPKTLPRLRPTIGMIHQAFNLTPRASVAANVVAGALPVIPTWRAVAGLAPPAHRRKACELMAEVGLTEAHLRRRVGELSGGQQQRVGVARAFMLDPAVVLADEPVASLDPKISAEILALLVRQARSRGATVLCSLHQIELAVEFADRIVAVQAGRLVFDGRPADFSSAMSSKIYGRAAVAPKVPSLEPAF